MENDRPYVIGLIIFAAIIFLVLIFGKCPEQFCSGYIPGPTLQVGKGGDNQRTGYHECMEEMMDQGHSYGDSNSICNGLLSAPGAEQIPLESY